MKPVTTYVTADLHFGHRRIAEFRPFASMEEHEEHIMDEWRKVVRPRDKVWVLGDAAFTLEGLAKLWMLPGTKYLVRGNHDGLLTAQYLRVFEEVYGLVKYKRRGRVPAWLSHAPIHPDELRGGVCIHGHTHHSVMGGPDYFNVCPEIVGYAPVNLHGLIPKRC